MAKIEDLRKELKERVSYDCDITLICDYEHGYIQDIISEISSNHVDCYTSDLLDWANDSEHIDYIDYAMCEWGTPNNFLDIISQGQAYYYEQLYQENIENICKYYYLIKLERLGIEEINEDTFEDFNYQDFDTLQEIEEQAQEDIEKQKYLILLDKINDYNFIQYTKEINSFINDNLDSDIISNFYIELCNILETNKATSIELLQFWLNSDLYKIDTLDFIALLNQVREDMESEEERKALERKLIAYEQDKAKSEEIENLGE